MNKTQIHSIIENELVARADIYKRLISKAMRTTNLEHVGRMLDLVFELAARRVKVNHKCETKSPVKSDPITRTVTVNISVCCCHRAAIEFVGEILDDQVRNSKRLGGNCAFN